MGAVICLPYTYQAHHMVYTWLFSSGFHVASTCGVYWVVSLARQADVICHVVVHTPPQSMILLSCALMEGPSKKSTSPDVVPTLYQRPDVGATLVQRHVFGGEPRTPQKP